MSKEKFAADYIDVAARVAEFRAKFPTGNLRPLNLEKPYSIEVVDGKTWVVVVAAAYRTPDDPNPGVGMAYEPVPGTTPFTRGSELQNAETAAWGRAMMATLAVDSKKGIASAEEVRNRQAENSALSQDTWPKISSIESALERAEAITQIESIREKALVAASNRAYTDVEIEKIKRLIVAAKTRVAKKSEISRPADPVPTVSDLQEYIDNVNGQEDYDTVKAAIEKSGYTDSVKGKLLKALDEKADSLGDTSLFD